MPQMRIFEGSESDVSLWGIMTEMKISEGFQSDLSLGHHASDKGFEGSESHDRASEDDI